MAALSAALAAALLEKLTLAPRDRRRARAIRQSCLALIERDALVFSRVIQATRTSPHVVAQRLKHATHIPCQIVRYARAVHEACRTAQREIKPQFRSDLRCAMALAHAADVSGRALIETNLAWLNDSAYAKRIRQQLGSAPRHHGR